MIYKKQLVVQWRLCVPGCENERRFEAVPEASQASRFLSPERCDMKYAKNTAVAGEGQA